MQTAGAGGIYIRYIEIGCDQRSLGASVPSDEYMTDVAVQLCPKPRAATC
jgi:hypothetical protein